jgi:rod shape-determining protein MreC
MQRFRITHKRLVTFLLILVFLIFFLFPELQNRPAYFMMRPFVYLISTLQKGLMVITQGAGGIWSDYVALVGVREENRKLREELYQLQNENIQRHEATAALERIEAFLEFKEQNPYPMIAARVIGRDPTNWYRTMMIDKGDKDGVRMDMGVIVPGGVVGRVMKTAPGFSQIQLMTDRNSAIAGLVQRTRDEGIIEGMEKGLARIKYLPALSESQEGDLIITSGLAGSFPKGLLVGRIQKMKSQERALFQEAEVAPMVDFSRLEEVLVITPAQDIILE